MAYKISGTILWIEPTQTLMSKTGTSFQKRDLVITVRKYDQYTGAPTEDTGNTPRFTFIGGGCQELDSMNTGDIVTIIFDISGRKYEKDGKTNYYTEVRPFKIEVQKRQITGTNPVVSSTSQNLGAMNAPGMMSAASGSLNKAEAVPVGMPPSQDFDPNNPLPF